LLISLSILGVIAALTLPGVITHMTWASNKAKLKATTSAVHQALYSAILDGSYTDVKDVLRAKLNYTHHCPPNDVAGPCAKAWWAAGHPASHSDRFIMSDGSIIWADSGGICAVYIKVVNDKDPSYATDGTGNALGLRYNHTMATFPAAYDYPDVPPGELKPHLLTTDLYKKVFE
jgi:type II secretory pathway pseudopilin PulG